MVRLKFNKNGFTLLEVMMAGVVLSIGLLAGVALLTLGLKNFDASGKELEALAIAQQGLELAKNFRDRGGMAVADINVPNLSVNGFTRVVTREQGTLNPAIFSSTVTWPKGGVLLKTYLYELPF